MAQFRSKIDACIPLKLNPIFVITQADKHVGAANSTAFRANPNSPVCAVAIKVFCGWWLGLICLTGPDG